MSEMLKYSIDSINVFKLFSIIHIFEPVPSFNKILTEKWDGHKIKNGWDATIYKCGLGSYDRYPETDKMHNAHNL